MLRLIENFTLFNKIKKFNNKNFSTHPIKKNRQILCEFSHNKITQVAFSYFINFLAKKYSCKLIAYQDLTDLNFFNEIKLFINNFFNLKNFYIYRSFNVKKFLFVKKNFKNSNISNQQLHSIKKRIKCGNDLLNFKIDNILIGDLIYDTYLKKYSVPSINFKDKNLDQLITNSIKVFYFWRSYLMKNNVKAVVVSDTVYTSTMISRISSIMGIDTYQCAWNNITKINKKNLYCYGRFIYYKNYFSKFKKNQKLKAISLAKKRINNRMKGEIGLDDQVNFSKSSWKPINSNKKIFLRSKNKKMLIAAHAFYDGPHAMGPDSILFNNFLDWMEFLAKISKQTNYDWYIKGHPNFSKNEVQILNKFIKKNNNIKLIPQYTSHYQIIKEGVDCILTVRGTIAWEYALHKIPVINASILNPHHNYDFCMHAKNIQEYKHMIFNFDKMKINFNKKEIYEFYFMHNLCGFSKWLLDDYKKTIKLLGGYQHISKLKFYEHWIKTSNLDKRNKINFILNNFVSSNKLFILEDSFIN